MRRIVWVAIGAVGGILAYRRAEQAMADVRERGVVLTARDAASTAAAAVGAVGRLATSRSADAEVPDSGSDPGEPSRGQR
jgi:hypothetical protein